jgi:predicted lipid-binding transport protein (Tim44 family)
LGSAPLQVQPPPQPVVGEFFIPADFNQPVFLQEAKKQFIAIQKAWDTMDFDGLQARLTDEMYAQYAGKMAAHGGANQTEVVTLDAALLGIEKLNDGYLASVRFTGMIREDPDRDAGAFEEVWNLYKPNERGWLLAGIQQLPTH